jgi:hypothetical protein
MRLLQTSLLQTLLVLPWGPPHPPKRRLLYLRPLPRPHPRLPGHGHPTVVLHLTGLCVCGVHKQRQHAIYGVVRDQRGGDWCGTGGSLSFRGRLWRWGDWMGKRRIVEGGGDGVEGGGEGACWG